VHLTLEEIEELINNLYEQCKLYDTVMLDIRKDITYKKFDNNKDLILLQRLEKLKSRNSRA